MNRWLVTLVWLLTLALPLQGMAASARMACHAGGTASTLALAAPTSPAMLPSMDPALPCHEAATSPAERAAGHPTKAAAPQGTQAAHAGCVACAACHGAAAALPFTTALPTAEAPSVAPDAPASTLALPYITDGPERPPRSLEA